MDDVLLLSIAFVFISALVSNVVQQRNRDRVLKELQGFHTTIEMQDGRLIWGKLSIFTNGVELRFTDTHYGKDGNPSTSYILYSDDLDKIRMIYRYHSELSVRNQCKREKEVKRTSNPSLIRRFKRSFRNFMNNFHDAINESMSLFLSRMKGRPSMPALDSQDKYLKKIGTSAMSMVGNAYDPILEHHINKRIIISVDESKGRKNFSGFLKEYSPSWLSVLDCHVKNKHRFTLSDIEHIEMQRDIDVTVFMSEGYEDNILIDVEVYYYGYKAMRLLHLEAEGYCHEVDETLKHGQSISFSLSDIPKPLLIDVDIKLLPIQFEMISVERLEGTERLEENDIYQTLLPDVDLVFEAERVVDVYIPRSLGRVRHSGEF